MSAAPIEMVEHRRNVLEPGLRLDRSGAPPHDSRSWERARPSLARASALSASLFAAWFVLFAAYFSGLQEHGAQARLYAQLRSQLANETAPYQAPIAPGSPIATLSVARLDISQMVIVEGTTSRQLRDGPGHEADTPLPGQIGTTVVMGHSLAFGGPFAHLHSLRIGDVLHVTTAEGRFAYRVEDVRRPGDPLPRPVSTGGGRLTLVTASGGWLGRLTPSKAFFVDAKLDQGRAQPVPAPLPSIGVAGHPMHGDRNALVPMIFWCEALLLAAMLVGVGWWRWGRWQVWVVGAPIMLASSWAVSDSLVQLLPNLL